ncbi:hypothetical protein C7N43_14275 [Sphingobacteriales bacterium UPWRP_1]|nr:hypothetical protein BVG80_11360 [Sphingobacteriales bacterium TSM_CSM]PSJ76377.1 hypothetical protein C7N43_14275 [Sphingobacteriales bacterium UPWRP_1]
MKTLCVKITAFLAFLMLFAFLFTACTKEDDKPAPAIPPANSLIMDFTKFPADEGKTTDEVATKANFGYAAVNVGWWNTVLVVNLAIPVAAFLESFNHDAVYDVATEKWTWSYNFNAAGWHTARLEATMAAPDEVHWEMYVSKAGAFTNFLWFSGNSKTDNSMATWLLRKDPAAPTDFVDIVWHNNATSGTSDIRYTNVSPTADNGAYIEYGLTNNELNAFYNIYLINGDNLVNIEWNTTTKEGRVKNLAHFGNEDWHCWDTLLEDVVCE